MIDTAMLQEARRQLADVMEEIGAVATLLRDAIEAAERDNLDFAAACCDDVIEANDNARDMLRRLRDLTGRWSVWAEGREHAQEEEVAHV
ncbi:MAG: hypothetical protein ACO3JG_14375 [Luteolibacter sp.]